MLLFSEKQCLLTVLGIAGQDRVVGAQEHHDQLDRRGCFALDEESTGQRQEPPGVVAAEASIDDVKSPFPPVRE